MAVVPTSRKRSRRVSLAFKVLKKRNTYANGASFKPAHSTKRRSNVHNTTRDYTHGKLTRGVTTAMSRNAVLNTQELQELILSHLPSKDLLTFRGVSKHWNGLITKSPELKKKLFLFGKANGSFWFLNAKSGKIEAYSKYEKKTVSGNLTEHHEPLAPAQLNTDLFINVSAKRSLIHRAYYREDIVFKATPDLSKHDSIFNRMHVCQPPVSHVNFKFVFSSQPFKRYRRVHDFIHEIRAEVFNTRGVKYGDILRKFRSEVKAQLLVTDAEVDKYAISIVASRVWVPVRIFVTDKEFEAVESGVYEPSQTDMLEL
ncbi:uncharacterized protein LTR77_005589 [Saxophila tyrrhenica]|uniref:F-box domain-containing protein n=1 Tax=Saxophila tyrrhenica TaxID=1690608 RepID=A0AAV9PC03_9PEZI|nr:hypothetical protein LTR77_005589 [Saxophila tyrrhenica]